MFSVWQLSCELTAFELQGNKKAQTHKNRGEVAVYLELRFRRDRHFCKGEITDILLNSVAFVCHGLFGALRVNKQQGTHVSQNKFTCKCKDT